MKPIEPSQAKAKAAEYWPYAAMASYVYRTEGDPPAKFALAASSSYLNDEINNAQDKVSLRERFNDYLKTEWDQYAITVNLKDCVGDSCAKPETDLAACAAVSCEPSAANTSEGTATSKNNSHVKRQLKVAKTPPTKSSDCDYRAADAKVLPYVPLAELYNKGDGWHLVPELQRNVYPVGWRIFVPGLTVDVWRHEIANTLPKHVEYAIVYRGTDDTGGMVSNLRTILSATPFVWDHYRQAELATRSIVGRIRDLHEISDNKIFNRSDAQKTKISITAVGHSLGGGIATYVFLRIPEITKVVGFDASPVNGAWSTSADQVAARQKYEKRHPDAPVPSINLLYEQGSVMEAFIADCRPGSLRGDVRADVHCDLANLSRGNRFDQHSIAQMSCHLYLVWQEATDMQGRELKPSSNTMRAE